MPDRLAFAIRPGSRSVATRHPPGRCRCMGGAIIEMLGILPLMVLFMLMTILVCRWLVFQGRILAAERTASWLVAHADDPTDAGGVVQGAEFAGKLRDWHFEPSGVVMVSAPIKTDGVLSQSTVDAVLGKMNEMGKDQASKNKTPEMFATSEVADSEVAPIGEEERNQRKVNKDSFERAENNDGLMAGAAGVIKSFMVGVMQFLTRDFQRTEVRVSYWMPSPFRVAAFERLAGGTVSRGSGNSSIPDTRKIEFVKGKDYLLLSRGEHTKCVMPVLDPGKDGGVGKAIGEVISQVDRVMKDVRKALKRNRNSDLYRPMVKGFDLSGNTTANVKDDAVVQDAFYALLMYEWQDPKHDAAKPAEWPAWLMLPFGDD